MDDEELVNDLIDAGASDDEIRQILAKRKPASPGARFADPNVPAQVQGTKEQVKATMAGGKPTGNRPLAPEGGAGESLLQKINPFQDEIAGAVGAAGALLPGGRSPGQAFTAEREASKARVEGYDREHPTDAKIGTVAGIVLPALATGGASLAANAGTVAKGANLAYKGRVPLRELIKAGAKTGAGAGAFYGAGNSEGSLGERAVQTGAGTVFGGTIGAVAPLAARAVGNVTKMGGKLLGVTTKTGRQRGVDRAIEEGLSSTGQNVDDALARAQRLRESGLQDVPVAAALGDAAPSVVSKASYALPTKRGASGVSPAGRAAQFAKSLQDDVAKAKGGGGRTGQVADDLYDQARKVGGIGLKDADGNPALPGKAQHALNYFRKQFPEAEKDVMEEFQQMMAEGSITFDDIVDPRSGNYTVRYWDELKKYLDGQIHARKATDLSWARGKGDKAKERLATIVKALDDDIEVRTGKAPAPYEQARGQARQDIGARKELIETQGPLAKGLKSASQRVGPEVNPETSFAQFGAERGKIGRADLLQDFLKVVTGKARGQQSGATLSALEHPDPVAFFTEALSRQARTKARSTAGAKAFGVGASSALQRALGENR